MRGTLEQDILLSKYTSWRVGGAARQCYWPVDAEDLSDFLQGGAQDEVYLWLGLGSNILVRDGGFAGTVILTLAGFRAITVLDECLVRVEAGVSCATFARQCARMHLGGAEFLAGVMSIIINQ